MTNTREENAAYLAREEQELELKRTGKLGQGRLNAMQTCVVHNYCGGEFSHLMGKSEAKACGDPLLYFLVLEAEDAESMEELARRVDTARNELEDLCFKLEGLE
jgi:hypothetical protein